MMFADMRPSPLVVIRLLHRAFFRHQNHPQPFMLLVLLNNTEVVPDVGVDTAPAISTIDIMSILR